MKRDLSFRFILGSSVLSFLAFIVATHQSNPYYTIYDHRDFQVPVIDRIVYVPYIIPPLLKYRPYYAASDYFDLVVHTPESLIYWTIPLIYHDSKLSKPHEEDSISKDVKEMKEKSPEIDKGAGSASSHETPTPTKQASPIEGSKDLSSIRDKTLLISLFNSPVGDRKVVNILTNIPGFKFTRKSNSKTISIQGLTIG